MNGFADSSRDLGSWVADAADIPGVDETSLCMKMVGMMFAPYLDTGEHLNKYDEGLDLFEDMPPAYPPVFGA